jgi:signal transduction histidine kinase
MPENTSELVERLAQHRTLGGVPRAELEWLAAHGELRRFEPGDTVVHKGAPIEYLWVVLTGRVAIFQDRGSGMQKVMEWQAGDVSGILPYSRMSVAPGETLVQGPSDVLAVHRNCFRDLARECPEITAILVHTMLDRARFFNARDLHDEKMVSLGKLSAGLAHELNNPASAIERSAATLEGRLQEAERATRALGAARLTDAQLAVVDGISDACHAARVSGVRSPIEQAEREDAIAGWLSAHGLDAGSAETLADTPVTIEALDRLAEAVQGPALDAVIRWTAAGCAVRSLGAEIQEAGRRIASLVASIKGFTHMDQAQIAEPVDVARGVADTVAVLRSKARSRKAAVAVETEPDLPRARGFVGELNQIWANLIDNALDAIPEAGRVEVTARREDGRIVVRVLDNGRGIPDSIREHIFDPFFTTKPVGEGTGLGLDIVRRLVRHNEGDIAVDSRPGRTEFRVALPLAKAPSA